ncbi:hypothetical protein G9A89_000489 [Geosiphon pyriformis]|nr:hypothetical protein G9A89_000489 [Geosiphon pyriformis]
MCLQLQKEDELGLRQAWEGVYKEIMNNYKALDGKENENDKNKVDQQIPKYSTLLTNLKYCRVWRQARNNASIEERNIVPQAMEQLQRLLCIHSRAISELLENSLVHRCSGGIKFLQDGSIFCACTKMRTEMPCRLVHDSHSKISISDEGSTNVLRVMIRNENMENVAVNDMVKNCKVTKSNTLLSKTE